MYIHMYVYIYIYIHDVDDIYIYIHTHMYRMLCVIFSTTFYYKLIARQGWGPANPQIS